jgi:hypothetical protein
VQALPHTEQSNDTPGVIVRKAFISYARANKPDIDQLVEHLNELGCQTWVDSSLHGGQDWWLEILRRIEDCDVFIATISREAMISVACEREFDWADALHKPVLPVALEPLPTALPRRYSRRQIVDYSEPANRDRAARRLGGGLLSLPPSPPLPRPLPRPPAAPLSYLTDLIELVSTRAALNHDQQRQVLQKLEPALRALDPEERRGGRAVLEKFSSRDDLYADVYRGITELKRLNDEASRTFAAESGRQPGTLIGPPVQPPKPDRAHGDPRRPMPDAVVAAPRRPQAFAGTSQPVHNSTQRRAERSPDSGFKQSNLGLPATLIAVAAISGAIPPIYLLSNDYPVSDDGRIWYWQTASRILIGIAFCFLARMAKSLGNKVAMLSALLMAPVILLHVANGFVLAKDDLSADTARMLKNIVYPTVLALTAMVGILFGAAVIRKHRVAWASILIAWGLCGLLEAYLSYEAKIAQWAPGDPPAAAWKAADSVLIVQNLILLTVAVFMFLEFRPTKNASAPDLTVTNPRPR